MNFVSGLPVVPHITFGQGRQKDRRDKLQKAMSVQLKYFPCPMPMKHSRQVNCFLQTLPPSWRRHFFDQRFSRKNMKIDGARSTPANSLPIAMRPSNAPRHVHGRTFGGLFGDILGGVFQGIAQSIFGGGRVIIDSNYPGYYDH